MKSLTKAFKFFVLMTLLTGVFYPLLITFIAQMTMPHLANGSLLYRKAIPIGSLLISQKMADDRYFWPRPSAIDFDPMKPSGGSNLGPISAQLKKNVEERRKKFGEDSPAELLYASGSGLDPHISLETAYFQLPRIAKARDIKEEDLKKIVTSFSEGKQFGFIGPRYINVLRLNLFLDQPESAKQ